MTGANRFAEWLRNRLKTLLIEPSDLAGRVGVNRSTIARWLAGKSRPSPDGLRALAETLNDPIGVLYEVAGYPADLGQLAGLDRDELELIANYRHLTPAQQRMLLAAARAGR